jgi:hypothetical protein
MRGKPMMRKAAIILMAIGSIGSGHAASQLNITAPLPSPTCTSAGDICGVTLPLGTLVYLDGDGYTATTFSSFILNIIKIKNPDGSSLTNWIANFDQYNNTETTDKNGQNPYESLYINFLDSSGAPIGQAEGVLIFQRDVCRDRGAQTMAGGLNVDVFAAGAVKVHITQETQAGPIGGC